MRRDGGRRFTYLNGIYIYIYSGRNYVAIIGILIILFAVLKLSIIVVVILVRKNY